MTEVVAVCAVDPTGTEVVEKLTAAEACFLRLRVEYRGALLSPDGRQMLCRFSAPDAESVRIALRQAGVTSISFRLGDNRYSQSG